MKFFGLGMLIALFCFTTEGNLKKFAKHNLPVKNTGLGIL